jgi:hypothetical protein
MTVHESTLPFGRPQVVVEPGAQIAKLSVRSTTEFRFPGR